MHPNSGRGPYPEREPVMKAFIETTKNSADPLEKALVNLSADVRVALLHYALSRKR